MRVSFARYTFAALLSILLLSVSSVALATSIRRPAPSARITALRVSTVDPSEGAMGTLEDIFANQTGNAPVFAGSGTANFPTHYLLVMVEVTGDEWTSKVSLTGREGRRVVYSKISSSSVAAGESGISPFKTYAVFFIEGDRCELLKLTARLVGQRRASTMTKTVRFVCGE